MSAFLLKLIALLAMIADHIGVVYQPLFDVTLLRCIGRIAFPVFLFFIAEGCRRTRNIELYLLRLGAFALISELPFDFALAQYKGVPYDIYSPFSYNLTEHQNVFFTFFLGASCVYLFQKFNEITTNLYKKFKDESIYLFYVVFVIVLVMFLTVISCIIYAGDMFNVDYGSIGVLFVFILYILPYGRKQDGKPIKLSAAGKWLRIAALFGLLYYLYIVQWIDITNLKLILEVGGIQALLDVYAIKLMLFGCISLLLLALYNNKRGRDQRWLFYLAYPLHLLVLGIIRFVYVSGR